MYVSGAGPSCALVLSEITDYSLGSLVSAFWSELFMVKYLLSYPVLQEDMKSHISVVFYWHSFFLQLWIFVWIHTKYTFGNRRRMLLENILFVHVYTVHSFLISYHAESMISYHAFCRLQYWTFMKGRGALWKHDIIELNLFGWSPFQVNTVSHCNSSG